MSWTAERLPQGCLIMFEDDICVVEFLYTKVNIDSKNQVTGFLKLTHNSKTSGKQTVLYYGKFNVASDRTRSSLAKHLTEDVAKDEYDLDWARLIEIFSQKALEIIFSTEPPQRIKPAEQTEPTFLIYPILPKHHPTLIYSPGGVGKSFLAMYLALFVQNGLSFRGNEVEKGEVLYADWEVDYEEASRRYGMLTENFVDVELEFPIYKRAYLPLEDELESIMEIIVKENVKLVIIDSAAPAIGGDVNDAHRVIKFFQGVRMMINLGASVLILTHVSKAEKGTEKSSPIGSVFFENLSRMTWELKSSLVDKGTLELVLLPRKSNFGMSDPIGFKLVFKFGKAYFHDLDSNILDVPLESSTKDIIVSLLANSPNGLTLKELTNLTGFNRNTIATTLSRMKKRGLVYNTSEGKWKIVERSDEIEFDLSD